MTLEEFLTARYAERQAGAERHHAYYQEQLWGRANIPGTNPAHLPWKRKEDIDYEIETRDTLVTARASTRMVEIHSGAHECPGTDGETCETLRLLAAPFAMWASHRNPSIAPHWLPDWQDAWVGDTPGQAAD